MTDSSDDEVIPASPSTSVPGRSHKKPRRSLARKPGNYRNLVATYNDILSQRVVTEAPLTQSCTFAGVRESETDSGEIPMQKEDFLRSLYGSPVREEERLSPVVLPPSIYDFPEVYQSDEERNKTRPGVTFPDFVSLSQILNNDGVKRSTPEGVAEPIAGPSGVRKPPGETQKLLYDDADDLFLDIPLQPDSRIYSSPERKKFKLNDNATNSPDIFLVDSEPLVTESPEKEPEEDLNKTVMLDAEEDNYGASPVIKGNIDVLSKSFEEICEPSQKCVSVPQKRKSFVDVQLVKRSFTDFSKPTIREVSAFSSSPTCSEKKAAPKRLFREAFDAPKESGFSGFQAPVKFQSGGGFQMANMKKIQISEETLKRVQKVLGDSAVFGDSPGFQTVSFRKAKSPEKIILPDEPPRVSQLFPDEETIEGFFKITQYPDVKVTTEPVEEVSLPEDIRKIREAAVKLQEGSIADKSKSYCEIFKSEELMKKLTPKRKKLKDFLNGRRPRSWSEAELLASGVTPSTLSLNWENSLELVFEGIEATISVDHFTVIPSLRNKIGFPELSRAFKASRGVNPHGIPEGWLENAWRFIVMKLAAMELSFPKQFGGQLLTPRNLLHQLHYRYFREIVLGQSPPIKRITQLEESSQKTLVLFVLDVKDENTVSLSDGWYKVQGRFDAALAERMKKGKIRAGTKLITQGCKLINCDNPHSPLDIPAHVMLQLHGNATRRSKWDTKLGFHAQFRPQCVSLDSVMFNGGLIPRLVVCVARVYPVVYIESFRERRKRPIVRSERMEMRHCTRLSTKCFDNFENMYNEMRGELMQRHSEQNISIRNITNISSIRDPEELNRLLRHSYDPESVENEMSGSQKDLVREHLAKLQEKRDREISESVWRRLRQQRLERRIKKLLQIRVVDAKRPGKSCNVNFWMPPEELAFGFKEGDFYELINCNAREIRNGDIYIDGPSAEEGDQNVRKLDRSLFNKSKQYDRRITPFNELPMRERPDFAEFDVIGVVVKIEEMQPNRKVEQVFLADAQKNLLRVTFWKGLSNFAYDDIVLLRAVLCFSNLQWRPCHVVDVPQLAVSEVTVITENPKSGTHQRALEELRQSLREYDFEDFMTQCLNKLS